MVTMCVYKEQNSRKKKRELTSLLDPAFLDDVLVTHGGSSWPVLPALPVWWRWRDSWWRVSRTVGLSEDQSAVCLTARLIPTWPKILPPSPWWISVYPSFAHYHLLFPPLALLTQPPPLLLPWFPSSGPHFLYFFASLSLSLLPSFLSSHSFYSVPLTLLFSWTSSVFRRSSSESAWKETKAEKGERGKKTAGQWIVSFSQQTKQATIHCLVRFLPP